MMLNPRHRYVIHQRGVPVFTTDDCDLLLAYLWGCDLREGYVVYDYEQPYPVDTPNLCAWIRPLACQADRFEELAIC